MNILITIRKILPACSWAFALVFLLLSAQITTAQKKTGLPVPRFVSLKSGQVNMRVGPGRNYQVEWLYVRKGLPMEIIQEFDNWRKVRDPQGNEGWVIHSLLAGDRVAIVTPWEIPQTQSQENSRQIPIVNMYAQADGNSNVVARIEAGVLAILHNCGNNWCKLTTIGEETETAIGFINQSQLWGIYPDESFSQ